MRFTSKYGPALLVSFANLVLNGTFVSAASIGVKVGGYREFGTTELHSESTTYWKKHTFHEERTDHHRTHLHAHGNTRPAADTTSGSAQAQAKPAAQTETKPQGSTPFNPNRKEYEGGVTVEDVDPAEDAPPARKPYHPHPEFIRTTEPSGHTWDEAAYKALPPLKSALKNPRRAKLQQRPKKTVSFAEPEPTFNPQDILDSPEAGDIGIETDGNSVDYGVIKKGRNSTSRTHGTATQAAAMATYSFTDTQNSKKCGRRKRKENKRQTGAPIVCDTDMTENNTDEGDEGLSLYGSHIKAKTINLTSKQGRINLLTALGYDYVSMKKKSKDAAWQSTSQSVAYHENRQFCRFQTDEEEGLIIKAADGICIEFVVERYSHTEATGGKKPKTTERSRLKDLPTAPGYEWLHEMDKRDDIIRIYVDERHDTMYMHQEGMSAVAKIVVSIIMSCISGGALSILTTILTNLTINTIEARGDPVKGTQKTLSKEGLKSIGRSYVGKLLIGGDFGVADGATWLANLQNAFMESLNTTLSDYLGRGIIDGDWRVNARRIGLDLVTSTAAKFGAKQIGGWRQGTIFDGDAFNYVSHKIMHGALAAAMSAATARIDHVKGADRRKRIMGAASGAMIAEAVGEYMMNGALAKVEEKLNASGHAQNSQAYADLRTQLMNEQLRQIKMFAQLAVAASAEAMRFDLNAAMFAANNALENDATRVFLALGRARVESQIQTILERDLAGKFYKGRGSSEQARAAISDALRHQGATDEQIQQVLSGKVGRLIEATDVFHKDWLKVDRKSDAIYVSCKLNDPSYLSQGLNLMSAAALALNECAREHPQLTQLTLSSIELAMGGVAGYLRTRVGDAVGLNDYVDGKIHQAESWLSGQLEGSLGMSAQKADMLASAGTFGMMFGFAGVVGNAKDKILKKAEDVTGKVKVYMTYFKDHPKGGVPYTGRTSGMVRSVDDLDGMRKVLINRDRNHHMNKEGFGKAKIDKATLNKNAARGREQHNINLNGGAQSAGGTSSNKINSVSGKNPKKETYESASKQEFGE